MTKLHQHDLLPLLLVTLLFPAQFCLAKQLNATTSFRHPVPERLLESSYEINCSSGSCSTKESLNSSEASYLFTMGPDSQSTLEFEYDSTKQILLSFYFNPNQPLDFAVNVSSNDLASTVIQATSQIGPVPIMLSSSDKNELFIIVTNPNKTSSASLFVKIIYLDMTYESVTPVWIVPLAAIGGMAFVLIMLIPVCYLKAANRRLNVQTLPLPAVVSGEKPDLDSLYPETKFEDLKSSFPQKTCSICFEDFQEGQPCRQFACQHIFHNHCVKPWLESQLQEKNNAACPNCKQPVTQDNSKKENS